MVNKAASACLNRGDRYAHEETWIKSGPRYQKFPLQTLSPTVVPRDIEVAPPDVPLKRGVGGRMSIDALPAQRGASEHQHKRRRKANSAEKIK